MTHAMVAVVAGKGVTRGGMSWKFWTLSILCSVLPDADVIAFSFGVPYGHVFGHRGFFHSIFFGIVLAFIVCLGFFRETPFVSRDGLILFVYFSLLTASHGIIDAFTNGGLGIALLSPFDTSRVFFPVTPIQVSPIGLKAFLSGWGLRTLVSEFVWVWLPALCILFVLRRLIGPKFFPKV